MQMTASGGASRSAFGTGEAFRRTGIQPLWIIAFWIAAGLAVLPFDRSISRFTEGQGVPGDVRALFGRSEVFGHGYGVLGIAITIYLLDPTRRRQLAYYVTTFISAGLAANLLKLQFWRTRPRFFDLDSTASTYVGSLWTDFHLDYEQLRNPANQSFPSGHTAGAVAAAYALSHIYPAGRRWFYTLAVLCAANRIDGNSHFASDVCWGVALGYGVALCVERLPQFRGLREEWLASDATQGGPLSDESSRAEPRQAKAA